MTIRECWIEYEKFIDDLYSKLYVGVLEFWNWFIDLSIAEGLFFVILVCIGLWAISGLFIDKQCDSYDSY
jgi:hypothetical protein